MKDRLATSMTMSISPLIPLTGTINGAAEFTARVPASFTGHRRWNDTNSGDINCPPTCFGKWLTQVGYASKFFFFGESMLLPSKRCLRLCLDHCTRNPVLLFHYSLSFRPIFISFPPCMNPYSLHKFVSKCYFVSNTISQRVPNMLSDHPFYNSRRIYSLTSPHVQLRLSSVKSSLFQVYNCEIFGVPSCWCV